jgi:hypothetical protein
MMLASITYGSVNGGPFSGVFAVQVELSGKGALLSTADVVDKIIRFIGKKKTPVRITGDLSAATPEEMFGFCKTLQDFGLKTSLICNGQTRTNWMSLIDWLIVVISDEPWLRFHCHELRYVLKKNLDVEPELPAQIPAIYLVPGRDVETEDVFRFIKKAKHPWAVILPAKGYVSQVWRARK